MQCFLVGYRGTCHFLLVFSSYTHYPKGHRAAWAITNLICNKRYWDNCFIKFNKLSETFEAWELYPDFHSVTFQFYKTTGSRYGLQLSINLFIGQVNVWETREHISENPRHSLTAREFLHALWKYTCWPIKTHLLSKLFYKIRWNAHLVRPQLH